MADMTVAFISAKCIDDATVPGIGRCEIGKTYKLNHWQARGWAKNFDLKNGEIVTEKVKVDDMPQDAVEDAVDMKEKNLREWLANMKNPPKKGEKKPEKPRKDVVAEMGAGKVNDLLASYDLPKLPTKEENVALVLAYEEALEAAKALTDEEKLAALKEFKIVKPESGDFDETAAIAKAISLKGVDTDAVGTDNERNRKQKEKAAREAAKGKGGKK